MATRIGGNRGYSARYQSLKFHGSDPWKEYFVDSMETFAVILIDWLPVKIKMVQNAGRGLSFIGTSTIGKITAGNLASTSLAPLTACKD
jgi:hypothetical protein